MVPDVALAVPAHPSATPPATPATQAVLAMAAIVTAFLVGPFLLPLCRGVAKKRFRCRPFRFLNEFLECNKRRDHPEPATIYVWRMKPAISATRGVASDYCSGLYTGNIGLRSPRDRGLKVGIGSDPGLA